MFSVEYLTELILTALAVLITLTVHEYCHGYAAYKLGDSTAKNLGRLTLNPIKHIDPIGAICMLLFHIGWAKPVPINARYFKKPRRDIAITALAGPLVNLILAFIFSGVYLLILAFVKDINFADNLTLLNILQNVLLFIYIFFSVNIGLAIFNLIPIPPLDGSKIFYPLFPPKLYFKIINYERQLNIFLIAWLFLGRLVARGLRMIPFIGTNSVLSGVVSIFSLSELLSYVINFVADLFLDFWQLIPFLSL